MLFVPGHCSVDLSRKANPPGTFQGKDSSVTLYPPKTIVAGGVPSIEADGHPRHSRLLESFDCFLVQKFGGARRDGGPKPERNALLEEGKEVWPLQRIAAREYHQRITKSADRFEQVESFFGVQFQGSASRNCARTAMHTGER